MQKEITQFINNHPDVKEVDVFAIDIPGKAFGKRYAIKDLYKIADGKAKMPAAMHLMCSKGFPVNGVSYGFDDGDPDAPITLIPGSLKYVSWESIPRAQAMVYFQSSTGEALFWEPRNVLMRVIDSLTQAGCFPVVAFELEFYLFDIQTDPDGNVQAPIARLSQRPDGLAVLSIDRLSEYGDCLSEIIDCCQLQGVLTGPVSAELGPGQYEINLQHHKDALDAADQCVLFQRIVRGVALKHGYRASFMAKPYLNESGSGFHFHVSLYDDQGNNLLSPEEDKNLRYIVSGLLKLMPASMLFFAPNINSYRRLQPGNNTPLSPNWGYENRSVAVRFPLSDNNNRRIEHRVAGADANPYLAMATVLAAIHYGLDSKQEPASPVQKIHLEAGGLPTDLRDAANICRDSEELQTYLGQEFVKLFVAHRLGELAEFEQFISAREYDWYI